MSTQTNQKLLTQLLNLPGEVVTRTEILEGMGVVFRIESVSRKAICPECGHESRRLHQNHWHLIKDLPVFSQPTYLQINRRQFKCDRCRKPFSETLDYVNHNRSYTQRLAQDIVNQVLHSNIHSVAQRTDVSDDEIVTMLEDAARTYIQEKPEQLKRLGLDELNWLHWPNFCAVLVDIDTGQPITLVETRTQKGLRQIFESWGKEVLNQIEEVSIDLWQAYKSLVEELMPNATVVADRFHVMKLVNEELDKRRRQEKRHAEKGEESQEKEQVLSGLKQSKYVLLKNGEDLNEQQKKKLEEVKTSVPSLGTMYDLKEELRKIFEKAQGWSNGALELLDWIRLSAEQFPKSSKTIVRWFGEISAYFESGTTNGIVEGINNKLKFIKRAAYGFKNFNNFKVRSLLCWHFQVKLA